MYTLVASDSSGGAGSCDDGTGGDSTGGDSTAAGLLATLVRPESQALAGEPALPGRSPSAGLLSAAWGRLMARAATVTAT